MTDDRLQVLQRDVALLVRDAYEEGRRQGHREARNERVEAAQPLLPNPVLAPKMPLPQGRAMPVIRPPYWDQFEAWQATLNEGDAWSHCGKVTPHAAHTHTIVMNEGPYPGSICVGTPDFSKRRGT